MLFFLTALWGAWKNSAEGIEFPVLWSLIGIAFFAGASLYNDWEPRWMGIAMGVAFGPLVYWLGKLQNRRRGNWRLFKPTRERNVIGVLLLFATMAGAFGAWWVVGEMWALVPILAVVMPVQWIILGVLIMRWRREDAAPKPHTGAGS